MRQPLSFTKLDWGFSFQTESEGAASPPLATTCQANDTSRASLSIRYSDEGGAVCIKPLYSLTGSPQPRKNKMTKRYDPFEEPKQPDAPKAKKPSKGSRRRKVNAQEALDRIQQNPSEANYAAVIAGFAERGILAEDIIPKENVFTFNAWKAKGRRVKKGEHSLKILTWVPIKSKGTEAEEGKEGKEGKLRPSRCALFHISQTQAIDTPIAVASGRVDPLDVAAIRNIKPPTEDLPSWLQ